jgi:heme oxygenase
MGHGAFPEMSMAIVFEKSDELVELLDEQLVMSKIDLADVDAFIEFLNKNETFHKKFDAYILATKLSMELSATYPMKSSQEMIMPNDLEKNDSRYPDSHVLSDFHLALVALAYVIISPYSFWLSLVLVLSFSRMATGSYSS